VGIRRVLQLARAHVRHRRRIAKAAALEVGRLWSRVDRDNIARSWQQQLPEAEAVVARAQVLAASAAGPYLEQLLAEYGQPAAGTGRVNVARLAGVAADGRPLDALVYQPAISALETIQRGGTVEQGLSTGAFTADLIARTQVTDAGRVADGLNVVAERNLHGYIRMLTLPSCSRCIILAGKFYEWNEGFERHPACDCVHIAAPEDDLDDLRTNPKKLFESMTEQQQNKIFTIAGAQAIRDGADMNQVVNVRRGAAGLSPAGGRLTRAEVTVLRGGRNIGRLQARNVFGQDLLVSTEGTTTRGLAGRRLGARIDGLKRPGGRYRSARAPRLMPEQIYKIAGTDRDEALRLLYRNGYLLQQPEPAPRKSSVPKPAAELASRAPIQPPPVDPPKPLPAAEDERPKIGDLIPRNGQEALDRGPAIREALMDVIDGDYGEFHVETLSSAISLKPNRIGFLAEIYHRDGGRVGDVTRTFIRGSEDGRDPDELWVDHTFLRLEPRVQGQGFAEEWNGRLEQWYRESGLSHISIHADIDVGGYAWARQGFDFADAEAADHCLDRLRNVQGKVEARADRISAFLRGEPEPDADDRDFDFDEPDDGEFAESNVDYFSNDDLSEGNRGALEVLLRQLVAEVDAAETMLERARASIFGSAAYPTPEELTQVGRRPGQGRDDLWIGKRAMLQSDWMGVKWLR
jgi:hypothetical protein